MKFRLTAIILIFLIFLVLSLIVVFLKPQNLLSKYGIFGNYYTDAKLTVVSENGLAEVFVDGESYGDTPIDSIELSEGQHEIVLRKIVKDQEKSIYPDQKLFIDMYRNTESVIDIELLPTGSYVGFVLYYTKAPSSETGKGYVTLTGAPADSTILLDDQPHKADQTRNLKLDAKSYNLKVTAKGYEDLQVPIVLREGYNLNVKVQLLSIPIEF